MKMLVASAATLVFLCAPVLAASPPRPEDRLKRRVTLRDAGRQTFDVLVATERAGHEVDSRLEIMASERRSASECHHRPSIPVTRGTTTELGSTAGPRREVAVQ
jgi:hypothetical protein